MARYKQNEIAIPSDREERRAILSEKVLEAWNSRDEILQNPQKYVSEFPDCKSGTSFSGPLFFPIGAILESWLNCPEFRLPDGRYVLKFASGLSGYTKGEAISLSTGKISDFESSAFCRCTRAVLIRSSEPYRRKAAEYVRAGAAPPSEKGKG